MEGEDDSGSTKKSIGTSLWIQENDILLTAATVNGIIVTEKFEKFKENKQWIII